MDIVVNHMLQGTRLFTEQDTITGITELVDCPANFAA